ncbi:MAG: hypothetical protein WA584_01760 [Pyrinomonadaceae bacterium]
MKESLNFPFSIFRFSFLPFTINSIFIYQSKFREIYAQINSKIVLGFSSCLFGRRSAVGEQKFDGFFGGKFH